MIYCSSIDKALLEIKGNHNSIINLHLLYILALLVDILTN